MFRKGFKTAYPGKGLFSNGAVQCQVYLLGVTRFACNCTGSDRICIQVLQVDILRHKPLRFETRRTPRNVQRPVQFRRGDSHILQTGCNFDFPVRRGGKRPVQRKSRQIQVTIGRRDKLPYILQAFKRGQPGIELRQSQGAPGGGYPQSGGLAPVDAGIEFVKGTEMQAPFHLLEIHALIIQDNFAADLFQVQVGPGNRNQPLGEMTRCFEIYYGPLDIFFPDYQVAVGFGEPPFPGHVKLRRHPVLSAGKYL